MQPLSLDYTAFDTVFESRGLFEGLCGQGKQTDLGCQRSIQVAFWPFHTHTRTVRGSHIILMCACCCV